MGSRKAVLESSRAAEADRYELYQKSVQEPEADVEFFNRVFEKEFERPGRVLREDFCGTGWLSCTWAAHHPENQSFGYDLDPEPIEWGRLNNLTDIDAEPRERVHMFEGNALEVGEPKADLVAALNFSYFCFKKREQLREYFRAAYENLSDEGLLIVDIEGGTETHAEGQDKRKVENFTYVWTQEKYDAISHHATCSIGFEFRDRSELPRAFVYDWRLWTLPEVREIMVEAGFNRADVYWEGTDDKTGEGNGEFTLETQAEQCEAWIAYVVAVKR